MTTFFNRPEQKDRRRALRRRQTACERDLWAVLRSRQLDGLKFFRQYGIANFIVDFYCPEKKLAIELDGDVHDKADVAKYDRIRSVWLHTNGVTMIRFTNEQLYHDISAVRESIAQRCRELPSWPQRRRGRA
jgi:very-short-patch-repair endonuclease